VDKLELARLRAILHIRYNQGEAQLPDAGGKLEDFLEGFEEDIPILLDYGFATENSEGTVVFTSDGIEFFEGEKLLTGWGRERDVLDREKSALRLRLEALWNYVKSLVQ
jgi:hypothetical protein